MESIKIRLYDLKYGNNLIGLPFTSIYRVDFIDSTTTGTYTGNKGICIGDIVNANPDEYNINGLVDANTDLTFTLIGNNTDTPYTGEVDPAGNINNLPDFNVNHPCDPDNGSVHIGYLMAALMAISNNKVLNMQIESGTIINNAYSNYSDDDILWNGHYALERGAWLNFEPAAGSGAVIYGHSDTISVSGLTVLNSEPTKISSILGFENNLFIYPGADPTTLNTLNNFFYEDEEGTISKDIPDGTILYHRSDNITNDATTVFSAIFTNGEWIAAAYDAQIDNLLQPARAYNIQLPANEMGWFIWSV